jgi:diketogulonate reductase-like aldo/keto reductase
MGSPIAPGVAGELGSDRALARSPRGRRARSSRPTRVTSTLTAIAQNRYKSAAQIVLRWHLQLGLVPIPKSASLKRLLENFSIFDFELAGEVMTAIFALDRRESAAIDSDTVGH